MSVIKRLLPTHSCHRRGAIANIARPSHTRPMVVWLLVFAALALMPIYLDNWFHDREAFELRMAVYAKPWQRWMMNSRNAGRYGSLGLLFVAMACLSTDYVQSLPTLTAVLGAVAAVSFLSFMTFQILPHTF